MSFVLRDYQQAAHDAVFEHWKQHQTTLVVMPTGTGKTLTFAQIIKTAHPKRAMVLAHRNELIIQARDKIESMTGLGVEIEKADLVASANLFSRCPVVVSSIQTQISGPTDHRRYLRFNPDDFGVLIVDESHHATSPSWREVVAHYRKNPELRVAGFTATPDRGDQEALGQVFESVAFNYGILDAIKDGWLVDITQQFVNVSGLDFSEVRTTAGDLNEGDLCKVMETEENIQGICQPTLEAVYGLAPKTLNGVPVPEWRTYLELLGKVPRRTIVFTVSVAQAEMCANVFGRAMKGVEWVCGKTPAEERNNIVHRFWTGETAVVSNCGIFLEGFDNPAVELISMARPTKSRALYAQCVGRSLRPLPGIVDPLPLPEARRNAITASPKPFARILDFVGNSGRHKLISCADILGGHVSQEAAERAKKKAMAEGTAKKILVTMTNEELEIAREKKEREAADERRKRAHLLARSKFSVQDRSAFDPSDISSETRLPRSKDGYMFSEAQVNVLRRAGYDPSRFAYRQGQAIIGKILEKPTEAQIKVIVRAGGQVNGMNRKQCSKLIDAIKANGWKMSPPEGTNQPQ